MTLADAVAQFQARKGAYKSSYERYRRDAKERGRVSLGVVTVRATKDGKAWLVDDEEVVRALIAWDEHYALLEQRTEDLQNGIIHGKEGERIEILHGWYETHGGFRKEWNSRGRVHGDTDGYWMCNGCNTSASQKHEKDECRVCRDWGGCGRDCKLSEVYCTACGTSLPQ